MAINPYGGSYSQTINPYAYGTGTQYIPQQPTSSVINMVLVKSEDEARNYYLNPGNSMFFMDSNNSVFYTKSVDFSGIPTFKKYTFHEVVDTTTPVVPDNYVTREEFEELKKTLNRKPQYQKREVKHESIS